MSLRWTIKNYKTGAQRLTLWNGKTKIAVFHQTPYTMLNWMPRERIHGQRCGVKAGRPFVGLPETIGE